LNEYTQRKIIGWTFALVLFLGIIEIKMFLSPPSTVLKAIALVQKQRNPASLVKAKDLPSNASLDVADEILDYTIPCKRKLTTIDAGHSKQLRVHLETCPHDKSDYRISSLINETNSYQGTLFDLDNNRQTSDFIPLKEGVNHFKITLTNSNHQKSEQEYIFSRATTKSQAH
jgi:hypothetical protein